MSNRYNKRELVWVTPFSATAIKYGFHTNADSAQRTALGHNAVNVGNLPIGLVLGANAPKPGKASKKFASGSVTSFYDIGQTGSLRANDWRVRPPTRRRRTTTARTTAVYVTIEGIKYAWMQANEVGIRIGDGDRAALGIINATSNDRDLVWGASYPQPSRASRTAGENLISTYFDPSKLDTLPEGWQVSGKEVVSEEEQ